MAKQKAPGERTMTIFGGLHKQARMFSRGLSRLLDVREDVAARPMGGRARAALARGDEGGALVEIALIVPALLGVMTGIITFGIAFSNQLTLTQAVGSAGQYLAQIRTSSTNPCADVFTALKNAAPGLTSANITLTTTLNGNVNNGTTCSGKQTQLVQGSPVSVYATYPCSLSIYGITFAGSCQLTAKVTEYEY
jgi:Flp pilus assembly protein TadG